MADVSSDIPQKVDTYRGKHPQSQPETPASEHRDSNNFHATDTARTQSLADEPAEKPPETPSGLVEDAGPVQDTEVAPTPSTTHSPCEEDHGSTSAADTSNAGDATQSPDESRNQQDSRSGSLTKPPINAPGRRGKRSPRIASSPRSPCAPRPELICRRNHASSIWQVIVVAENGLRSVRRDSHELTIEREECILDSFTGALSVSCGTTQPFEELEVTGQQPVAIFKFVSNWRDHGRKVEHITSGHYIVIAPKGFTQNGHVPHEEEPCDDDRYRAFYFYLEKSGDTSDPPGFDEYLLPAETRNYQLKGKSLFDSSRMGPLFVDAVPKLSDPSNIPWVRIGEEREGGWKGENFRPQETTIEHMLNGRQGRFFLRVYDDTGKLIDSDEFRYVRDLEEIRVNCERFTTSQVILPGPEGHAPTTVSFIGRGNAVIHPRLAEGATHASVHDNTVVVEPNAGSDRIECLLPLGDASVEVVVALPRVWWRLEPQNAPPRDWQTTLISVKRDRFRQLAKSKASICLKLPNPIKRIKVGLDGETDRMYRRSGSDNLVRIPLIDFIDYKQMDDRPYDPVEMSTRLAEAETVVTFLKVTAEPLPAILNFESDQRELVHGEVATLRWTTRNAHPNGIVIEPDIGAVEIEGSRDVSPHATTTYTLRLSVAGRDNITASTTVTVFPQACQNQLDPYVKCRYGWRHGKGFSRSELELAGLDTIGMHSVHGLRVDTRRRTTHPHNVKVIRELLINA